MKKTISISLALLLLITSIGFALNTHFCGGEAVKTSFSIGLNDLDCGMEKMVEDCAAPTHESTNLNKQSCCDNQHQVLQLDENETILSSSVNVNPIFFVTFIHSFVKPLFFSEQRLVDSVDYLSPSPYKDIQILYQTFLI